MERTLIEQLSAKYPLFHYMVDGRGHVMVHFSTSGSISIPPGEFDTPKDSNKYYLDIFERQHRALEIKTHWEKLYTHLSFYVPVGGDFPSSVYVKGSDGRDWDAIRFSFTDYDGLQTEKLRKALQYLDGEAEKAQQDGWFFCYLCHKAMPPRLYGYHYFASRYCQQCLDMHPDLERQARSETYE